MGRIAEALVATAIGILIAIPAVAAFNAFQRVVKGTLANTEALGHLLLAHLKSVPLPAGTEAVEVVEPRPSSRKDVSEDSERN